MQTEARGSSHGKPELSTLSGRPPDRITQASRTNQQAFPEAVFSKEAKCHDFQEMDSSVSRPPWSWFWSLQEHEQPSPTVHHQRNDARPE